MLVFQIRRAVLSLVGLSLPASGRQAQEEREFKVILVYIGISKPS